ncbi:MAG TPA: prepilin-type N-terminal cleavage/methylation domain-containing protein [Geomobilimonas sp.]|nr:prepilin-type N-terminal cleavage/methylation domain-containing protein [Geomobilimonas sp.]
MADLKEKQRTVSPSGTTMGCLRHQQGFTLIELLVALVLLMIGFLAVFTVLWGSAASGRFTRDMTTAASLGQDMLERAKTLSYGSLPATTGFVSYTAASVSAKGFTREWQIMNDFPEAGMKTVKARVSWNNIVGSGGVQTSTRTFTMTRRPEY